jgi:hypothetical protein
MYSPYNPPGAGYPPPPFVAGYAMHEPYVPLGWRTLLASIGLAAVVLASFIVDAASLAFAADLKAAEPPLGASLIALGAALALLAAHAFAATFFCIWVHRAAKNLLALGRRGMLFTPGWCVGWFFVPFANLVKPLQAVQEVWRASDPDAAEGYWQHARTTPLFGLWWATWLVGNALANVSARVDDVAASGAIGLVGSTITAVAAVACIFIMHRLGSRQEAAAARLPQR